MFSKVFKVVLLTLPRECVCVCVCVCVAKLSGFKINTVYLKSQNKKKPIFLKDLNDVPLFYDPPCL